MSLIAYLLGHFTQFFYFLPIFFIPCLMFFSKKLFLHIFVFAFAIFLGQIHELRIKTQRNVFSQVSSEPFKSKVINFPQQKANYKRYRLSYENQVIELICSHQCPDMYPGETWAWRGKIKAIETYHNFHDLSFWYEPMHHHLLGQVWVEGPQLKYISPIAKHDFINQIRKNIYQAIYAKMPSTNDHFARALFLALILGLGSELDTDEWALFKNTGIVHLMVVSGAHFNLLLGLVMQLCGLVYLIVPQLARWIPRQTFVASIALILGFIYVAISGFGIPIQRAWLMSLVRFLPFFGLSQYSIWQGMRFSIYTVLAFEPHAIFYPGAYLSYFAVIALIMAEELTQKLKKLQSILSQLYCHFFMMPLCFLWFGQYPLLAFVVNMFAIPWVSYLFLPMAFMNAVLFLLKCPPILLDFFKLNSQLFAYVLNKLQALPFTSFDYIGLTSIDAFVCLLGILIWLLCPIFSCRVIAITLCFLGLTSEKLILHNNEFQADIIDVGQGLAVLLHTKNHRLLYDLGPKKAAYRALLPYLESMKHLPLDGLVLSHHDADHIGGLELIMQRFPHLPIIVDSVEKYSNLKTKLINCHEVLDWRWNGVQFSFLKYAKQHSSKNNHSCVLKIANRHFGLLIPGDIEKSAEKRLLKIYGKNLKAQVLVLAHHGSHSSSSQAFIEAISPKLGVISYGKGNAYGHPHQEVLQRFKSLDIPLLSSAIDGMIKVYFLEHVWFYERHHSSVKDYFSSFCSIFDNWLLLKMAQFVRI